MKDMTSSSLQFHPPKLSLIGYFSKSYKISTSPWAYLIGEDVALDSTPLETSGVAT